MSLPRAPDLSMSRRQQRSLVTGAGVVAAGGVLVLLAGQLASVQWTVLLSALQWWAVPVAALAVTGSVLGAAWNLAGFSPVRLSTSRAVAAQLAGTALKVVTPASVGTVAAGARVVHRSGAGAGPAMVAVAASQVAQLVVTALVLAAVAAGSVVAGSSVSGTTAPVGGTRTPVAVGLAAAGAAGVLVLTRRWWWRLVPVTAVARLREVTPQLLGVVRDPRRAAAGFGGCVLLTAGLAAALWACVRAVGGELPALAALVVLLAGSAVGSSVPTPGGIGGVEAAMTAGLVAAGVPLAQAAPAVVLYRLLTFWLLVPLGTVAAGALRRRDLL